MEAFFALLVLAGIVYAVQKNTKNQKLLADPRRSGRVRHLRTGEYPSSCSWCKSTALARKLIVFQRHDASWQAVDLMRHLQQCSEHDVEGMAQLLVAEHPNWRRICTEKCAKEFFASEHVPTSERFASCEYCSVRSPLSLAMCPNCGAQRRAAS